MLAGVLLKIGGYGMIRFNLSMFEDAARDYAPASWCSRRIAIIYGALVALPQPDWKHLVAYSSVSHMGFVTLGIFAFNMHGMHGAMIVMLAHGLVTGALFLCVGVIYERAHTREISAFGGLATTHADLRHALRGLHAGLARAAGPVRVRRRVPGDDGRIRGVPLGRYLGYGRRDPLRLVHDAHVPAGIFERAAGEPPDPHDGALAHAMPVVSGGSGHDERGARDTRVRWANSIPPPGPTSTARNWQRWYRC